MKCELCVNTDYTEIWNKTERDKENKLYSKVIRDENNSIINGGNVICNNCGLVYIIPKMDREGLKDFYGKHYRETYKLNPKAEMNHAKNALDFLIATKTLVTPFLDIGASTGKLVDAVKDIAKINKVVAPVIGIDAAQEAKNVQKVDILDYETDIKFRCITMLNTLEHMHSPVKVLKKIHSIMDEKAALMVSVPDLLNTNVQITMDAYLSNAHLYNFTEKTLAAMLVKTGFRPIFSNYIPEEIGNKLYIIALRAKPQEPEYKKPDIEKLKAFLSCANDLCILKAMMTVGAMR